ncbi:MAG: hypothetical protein VR73_04400 [Gammaproteobacteria bacterium BRH_c0]|nr:MAG: hypothetical protein VR73_04400 [Gammaproteobacteria bacterium BRH_c0]
MTTTKHHTGLSPLISGFRPPLLLTSALLGALLLTQASFTVAAAKGETLGFALTWFGIANYEGEEDCPNGLAVAPDRDAYLASKTEEERAVLTDPKNQGGLMLEMVKRGPGGLNACNHPETAVEPPLRTVQGNTAYGLNLTGTDGSSPAPNTCPHQKFANGLNGEDNVDNQYYRVNGCQFGLRNDSPGGYITQYRSGVMLDGNYTILVEVSGVDDRQNDDEVSIGIYQGQDPVVRDAAGQAVLTDASLRVMDDPQYQTVMKGKIVNGVILSTERKDVYLIEKANEASLAKPHLHFRDARIRMEVDEAGNFSGVLAGYHDWLPLYRTVSKAFSFGETSTGFTCPAVYQAYKSMADGYPDPDTGECTAISIGYLIKGIPTYVIHSDKSAVDKVAEQ